MAEGAAAVEDIPAAVTSRNRIACALSHIIYSLFSLISYLRKSARRTAGLGEIPQQYAAFLIGSELLYRAFSHQQHEQLRMRSSRTMTMIHARVSFSKKLHRHPMINLRAFQPYFGFERGISLLCYHDMRDAVERD